MKALKSKYHTEIGEARNSEDMHAINKWAAECWARLTNKLAKIQQRNFSLGDMGKPKDPTRKTPAEINKGYTFQKQKRAMGEILKNITTKY